MRTISIITWNSLLVSILLLVGCSSWNREASAVSDPEIEKILISDEAKSIDALDLQGKRVQLSDFNGKVVLLNFWGSWCGPCRMETPQLVQLRENLKERGFEILGVNAGDSRESALQFMARYNMRYPVVADNGITDLYEVNGFPTNILIDRDGQIRYRIEGYNPAEIERLGRVAEYLLGTKS